MYKSGRFINNFSIYFAGLLSSGLISFVTIPIIVNYYGVEGYGSFSLVQNVVLILVAFGGGWLNQCVLRFNDYSTNFKFQIFQLYFVTIVPIFFLCYLIISFLNVGFLISLTGALTMFLGSIIALSVVFYQSKFKASKSFFFDFVRIVSFFLTVLLFNYIFLELPSIVRLMLGFCSSYLISFVFLLRVDFNFFVVAVKMFFKKFSHKNFVLLFKNNNYLFQYGWPLTLWFTVSMILNIADRYIIDYYLTARDLGVYCAIYDLFYKGISVLFAPILVAGFPVMTEKFNSGNKLDAFRFLKKLIVFEIVLFLIIAVIAYYLRFFLIEKVVGIDVTKESISLVLPILLGAFIWQLAMLVHKPLEFELKTKMMLLFSFIALLVNVVLNIIFIPRLGILFAAYSTVICSIVYLLLTIANITFSKKRLVCGT